jgi:alpha-N-arabinofuranosidase
MEKQAGLNPAFLRLPGGNYLEGDTVATRFDWKKTIGPLEGRPGHQGPWGYRSSDGMGLLEMLEWCEDLHMEPLLAVYAGYSLNRYKNPNPERAAPGPALQPFVQDALDEIEYLTGDAHSTRWGAERARDGHPTPFSLHYVEIGNEDWFDQSGSYDGRFAQFFDAIRAKYPHLQLIATAPVRTRVPDIIDEHYYLSAAVFESRVHQYDSYKRTGPKIFVGEWASQSGNPTPDLNAALGDAAWLTGIERNADVVVLESYAPLLVNINPGAAQWGTNLIGYDALHSYGSPSYWAQAMFANNHGDVVVPAKWEGGSRLACSVTRDSASGKIYIKLVNAAHGAQAIGIDLPGFAQIDPVGSEITLHSSLLHDTNTITEPEKVVPVRSKLNGVGAHFTFTAPGYSVTVLTIGAR